MADVEDGGVGGLEAASENQLDGIQRVGELLVLEDIHSHLMAQVKIKTLVANCRKLGIVITRQTGGRVGHRLISEQDAVRLLNRQKVGSDKPEEVGSDKLEEVANLQMSVPGEGDSIQDGSASAAPVIAGPIVRSLKAGYSLQLEFQSPVLQLMLKEMRRWLTSDHVGNRYTSQISSETFKRNLCRVLLYLGYVHKTLGVRFPELEECKNYDQFVKFLDWLKEERLTEPRTRITHTSAVIMVLKFLYRDSCASVTDVQAIEHLQDLRQINNHLARQLGSRRDAGDANKLKRYVSLLLIVFWQALGAGLVQELGIIGTACTAIPCFTFLGSRLQ